MRRPKDYDYLKTPFWAKVIYPASLTMVTAPPKAGKTSALVSLVGSLSKGETWGEYTPSRPLTVLYWDLENPDVIQWDKIEPYRNPNLWVVDRGWDDETFDITKVPPILERKNLYPDIIVVDPFVFANASTKENDAKAMATAMRKYIRFARITKRAVIIAHHDRKPSTDGMPDDPRWSGRGSSAVPGAVDVQMNITIRGRRADRRILQTTFNRYGSTDDHEPSWELRYDNETHITTATKILL